MANQLEVLQKIHELIRTLQGDIDGVAVSMAKVSKEAREAKVHMEFKSPKKVNEQLQKTANFTEQVNAKIKEQNRLEKALITQIERKEKTLEATNRALVKQKLETQAIQKQLRLEEKSTNKLVGAYANLNAKLELMRKSYKDLSAKKVQGIALTKKEQKEYQRLGLNIRKTDAALKGIDRSVGQNFRNVGNYRSAISGLTQSFRSLLSAFGLTSGVYLFAGAVRDAINRVRDFDKSMLNLAGVMRTTRDDLKDLEGTIISVAGATIRTSNEVAKLAESLATLGKSKDEIKDLLKPIIDLSLGLDTPADEAGEFLVQMLNTFGESTDKAVEFADTIATIRTSTTLDFQRMRDSFAYIAPISRILGEDLAYTGAVVGILADNGLKAEQAGRLLATAQIKLATQGKTLQDALEEINKLYDDGASSLEILAAANDLFGKQASKIGAILAVNSEALEVNAQAIRDNGGALEDLTNQQLESLDAKIKILDSTYERFILSLENGDSVLGGFAKNGIDFLTASIVKVQVATQNWETELKGFFGFLTFNQQLIQSAQDDYAELAKSMSDATKEIEAQNKAFIDYNKNIDATIDSIAPFTEAQQEMIDNQLQLNGLFSSGTGAFAKETVRTINDINKEIKELNDQINEADILDREYIKTLVDKKKALEEEKKAILGVTVTRKEGMKAIEGSIAAFKEQIKKLTELRDKTALTSEEYEDFNSQIETLEFTISELNGEYEKWLDNLEKGLDLDISFDEAFAKAADELDFGFIDLDELELLVEAEKVIEVEKQILAQRKELRKNFYESLGELAKASIDSIYQSQINGYDKDIQANNDYYAALLDNESLSQEQRDQLQAERERKNQALEKKKAETEKKAFLFRQLATLAEIAIDTVQAVAEIKAQAAILAANPVTAPLAALALSQIPIVIGSGAAAAGIVVATSLPQFAEGKNERDNYEGLMIWGEKQPEVRVSKSGAIDVATSPTLGYTKPGDTIFPSFQDFGKSDLYNQVISMQLADQNQYLTASQNNSVAGEIERALSKMKQPVVNNNIQPLNYRKLAKAIILEKKSDI